jgi:DNA-binding transcriptional regulator GbsR (MarR family)
MQELVTAANAPRLANTEYRHIIDLIKRLINDSNMNVVMMDLKIIGALAKGLRKHFYPYAKMFFGNIITKFKDKKTLMIEETNNCLNDFNYCLAIEDVIEDIKEGLADKNPNEKVHLMNWIDRVVEKRVNERIFT